MSKRKRTSEYNSVTISQSRSQRKKTECAVENFAAQCLRKAGFVLGKTDVPNELNADESDFVRDLSVELKPDVVTEFLKSFQEILQDQLRLKWSLLPTATSESCKTARNPCQNSLIHLLLEMDALQEPISTFLIEKLAEFSYSEEMEIFDETSDKCLARMILSQFRWLSKLINNKSLASQLLELVKVTPIEVQRDIISLMPEITCVSDHATIASTLSELLLENNALAVPILETLSNFIIDSESLSDIRKDVLKILSTVDANDLAGVVRFSLTNLKSEEVSFTVNAIRVGVVDYLQASHPTFSSTPVSQKDKQSQSDVETQIMNAISLSLRFQKQLCNVWIKNLDSLSNYKPFDFLMLVLLRTLKQLEKKVDTIIKKQVKEGRFTEDLVELTFKCHSTALKEYISTLLNLAKLLLSSIEHNFSSIGGFLYTKCFLLFNSFAQQEVVGNLVTHINNGSFAEVNAALSTFNVLVKENTKRMLSFSIFVKNLLDTFGNLTLCQIREVYQMLCFLAYEGGREGKIIENDIHIIIKKQLGNGALRYRKMGVIGALTVAKIACQVLGKTPRKKGGNEIQKAICMLQLVHKSVGNSPEARALFYDELSQFLNEGHLIKEIKKWIEQHLLSDFMETYTVDVESHKSSLAFNEADFKFGLADEPVALNLYNILKLPMKQGTGKQTTLDLENLTQSFRTSSHMVRSSCRDGDDTMLRNLQQVPYDSCSGDASSSTPTQAYPLVLAPSFHLLRVVNKGKEMQTIKELLGCPILLSEIHHAKFSTLSVKDKHFCMDMLFYCINWIIENINGFASMEKKQILSMVVRRLQLLIELQELVCKYVPDASNYTPPLADFNWEVRDMPPLKFSVKKPTQKKKKKTVKWKKPSENSVDSDKTHMSQSSDSDFDRITSDTSDTMGLSALSYLQPYLRELDLDVFSLLKLGITLRKRSSLSSSKNEDMSLQPKELNFLLGDLLRKLNHVLTTSFRGRFKSSQKSIGYSNLGLHTTDEIIESCIGLLQHICRLLAECSNYFRNVIASSDGMIDSKALQTEDSQLMLQSMSLLLKILGCFFSWNGFQLSGKLVVLKKALRHLCSCDDQMPEDSDLQALISSAIQYLAKFDDAITSLSCAATLVNLVKVITTFSQQSAPKKQLSEISKSFLEQSWMELDKNYKVSTTNLSIQTLLETYVKFNGSTLKSLEYLCEEVIPNVTAESATNVNATFKTLNKSTFSAYYKVIFNVLANEMKAYYATKANESNEEEDELMLWSVAIKVFHILINLIKTFDARIFVNAALKCGRLFVDTFLRHGMPLMDKMFSSSRENVINLLKNLQASTRYMQHICSYSKGSKDVALTKQVPLLKKSLETFVYRVKMMLAVNRCGEAFWLGNLRNRDLKGEEILTQKPNESGSDSMNSSEDDPADEENSPQPPESDKNSSSEIELESD